MLIISGCTAITQTTAAHTKTGRDTVDITSLNDPPPYAYWFQEAKATVRDITNEWECLKHEDHFDEFVILLIRLSESELAKKVPATQVVKVIQSVVRLPLIRELVFKASKETNAAVQDTLRKIQGYVKFGELCTSWYCKAGKSTDDLPEKWASLENEENFAGFTSLLKRLGEDKLKDRIAATDVVEVIQLVIESPSTRKLIFNESWAASANCHDRPLSIFNRVQGLARFGKLESEGATPQKLLALAKGLVKQTLISEAVPYVMTYQWEDNKRLKGNADDTGPCLDEELMYEVALCHALGKELDLPYYAEPVNMNYCIQDKSVAALTKTDVLKAKNYVNEKMNDQDVLVTNLISHPVWKHYMSAFYTNDIISIEKRYGVILSRLEDNHKNKSITDSEYERDLLKQHSDYKQEINTLLKSKTRQLCKESTQGCVLL